VVPAAWDWLLFCRKAGTLIRFAFEKADAQEKYGRENIFMAAMGGRSLRATGEAVYGTGCMAMNDSDPVTEEVTEEVGRSARTFRGLARDGDPGTVDARAFTMVGGIEAWRPLFLVLSEHLPIGAYGGGDADGEERAA
jgi:hypothetical protein